MPAIEDDGAETDGATVGEFGEVLTGEVDDGELLVASDPHMVAVAILGGDLPEFDGGRERLGQIGDDGVRIGRILADGLTMNVLEPHAAQ